MLIKINLETRKIESYRIDWPYSIHWSIDEQSAIHSNTDPAKFQPPFKGYQVAEHRLIAKVLEARMYYGEMEAVLDEDNNLVDIHITYPDLGEEG